MNKATTGDSATHFAAQAGEQLDLRASLARLWIHRWWIVTSMVLVAAAFAGVAFFMPPVYQVTTVLAPVKEDRGLGELASGPGSLGSLTSLVGLNLGGGGEKTQEALAVLRSHQFTERFIEERALMPKLFARHWDAARNVWKDDARHQPTLAKAYKYFDKKIREVAQDRKTGLISMSLHWRDRFEAVSWANELVRRLNAEMRTRATTQANDSITYLEKELTVTTVFETRQAINRLIEAQVKQRMVANVTQEYAFRVIDPAMAPDFDDPEWPNKPLLLILGPIAGLALGVFVALMRERLVAPRPRD